MRASWTVCSTPRSHGCSQQELMRQSVSTRTEHMHGRSCLAVLYTLNVIYSVHHHNWPPMGAIQCL